MQTKIRSGYEAVLNVVVGFLVGIGSQMVIFPILGLQVSISENIIICIWFTLISLIRTYLLRRWFNRGDK